MAKYSPVVPCVFLTCHYPDMKCSTGLPLKHQLSIGPGCDGLLASKDKLLIMCTELQVCAHNYNYMHIITKVVLLMHLSLWNQASRHITDYVLLTQVNH